MISKRTQRTKISIIIILTILLSVVSISEGKDIVLANEIATQTDASNQDYAIYEGDGYSVEFKLDSKWTGGFNATVTIINTSDNIINNWSIIMPLDESIINIWNAEVSDYGKGNYIIKNADWNQDIPSNGSVSFGFTSNNDFSSFPKHYDILSKKITINSDDYYVSYETKNAWDKGLVGEIYIKNNKDTQIEDWTISFSYKGQIENIWDAKIISHVNDRYIISAEDYNQNIKPNSSVSFGFITDENIDEPPYDFELEEYTDGIERSGVDVVDFSDGKLGNISNVGTLLGTYDIGNIMDEHNISMRVTNQKVSIWCDDKIVVDELYLPNEYGYAFGPITSHIKHDCNQVSYFTFSDIQMSSTIEY